MKTFTYLSKVLLVVLFATIVSLPKTFAWSEHPLIVYPVLKSIPRVVNAQPVEVKTLMQFLIEEEKGIAALLSKQEEWSRANLKSYAPRPDGLAFIATGNPDDIVLRFLTALRVNPNIKLALYHHLPPGLENPGRDTIDFRLLTTLDSSKEMEAATYLLLHQGDLIEPIFVLASANNEPDYGFDLGLFQDNNTAWGQKYGFGEQTFGNPNLAYSSQAPFHMGFYHESWIVFAAASFLKRTFVEYRINLYQTLAEYAFSVGQDYWGYRFMGWAMHYIGDLSMPYHSSVLPGVSTIRMLWINLKAMLGWPKSRDNAVQLVSNQHTVFEQFQWMVLKQAFVTGDTQHPFLKALSTPTKHADFNSDFPRKVIARESYRKGRATARALKRNLPKKLVNDPSFEVSGSVELDNLLDVMLAHKGQESIDKMTDVVAERFSAYSMHMRSFVDFMLK
jgi:hypothetical protein